MIMPWAENGLRMNDELVVGTWSGRIQYSLVWFQQNSDELFKNQLVTEKFI